MTPTIPASPAPGDELVEIDLTDPVALDRLLEARHALRFNQDHIVEWLRTSGGTLAERMMKTAAADLIEGRGTPAA